MNASSSAANVRREYAAARLDEADVASDPILQFTHWFQEALGSGFAEPTAMTLATVGAGGRPAARIVLLKGFDARGFVFFTNFESRKGHDLATHPFAALLFHWVELERQVRIEGSVEKIAPSESDDYFATRPLGSRLGAWASPQSQLLPSRAWLEERLAQAAATHGDNPPRPAHWGGYRLAPEALEFWQGRPNRLHDRIQYVREPDGGWRVQRLAP